ncbi:MAG: PDZ domain-containing protein [Woeseiaceae bacterium]
MKVLKKLALTAATLLVSASVLAQDNSESDERARQAQARAYERQAEEAARADEVRAVEEVRREQEDVRRTAEVEVEMRMQDAERRLAEAAQQVAELSMAQLPRVERLERIIRTSRGPVLGVTIGGDDDSGPVAGVEVIGVSPGGAAADSGLRAGDVITSINGESLTADSSEEANSKLLDFMKGVEQGDTLDVEYLRNSRSNAIEITPRPMENNVFTFGFDSSGFPVPNVQVAPNAPHFGGGFSWATSGDGFGDMELVRLTERLGSYFGSDEGLLVVRAPADEDLQLEDGDVILSIDGRTPTSVGHAMRILGSYESGEELNIEIMRDQRKRSITLEIPDNRQSTSRPAMPPVAPVAPRHKVVVVEQEKT